MPIGLGERGNILARMKMLHGTGMGEAAVFGSGGCGFQRRVSETERSAGAVECDDRARHRDPSTGAMRIR